MEARPTVSANRYCPRCQNDLLDGGPDLCVGCRNEQDGLCRWCGCRPPQQASDLCARCENASAVAIETGSFRAAVEVADFSAQLSRY